MLHAARGQLVLPIYKAILKKWYKPPMNNKIMFHRHIRQEAKENNFNDIVVAVLNDRSASLSEKCYQQIFRILLPTEKAQSKFRKIY